VLLLKYADEKQIKAECLKTKDITREFISDFLVWLEQERENSISTRNQRLAAVHALFRYIQTQAPELMFQCQQILALPYKKCSKPPIRYLDIDETKLLLASPDTSTKKGRRNQALLCLLYDSGARVQELADLKVMDLRFETPAQVKLL
jgi:site-specific recombinase XerD